MKTPTGNPQNDLWMQIGLITNGQNYREGNFQ